MLLSTMSDNVYNVHGAAAAVAQYLCKIVAVLWWYLALVLKYLFSYIRTSLVRRGRQGIRVLSHLVDSAVPATPSLPSVAGKRARSRRLSTFRGRLLALSFRAQQTQRHFQHNMVMA